MLDNIVDLVPKFKESENKEKKFVKLADYVYQNMPSLRDLVLRRFRLDVFWGVAVVLNVACQYLLIDFYLGGGFYLYGYEMLNVYFSEDKPSINPADQLFPGVVQCKIFKI